MMQGTIFSLPHNGTDTSRAAAESMRGRAVVDRERVLNYVAAQGDEGCTCDEAEQGLGMTHQSCSARFSDLAHSLIPRLKPSGRTRPTRSHRQAVVWVVA